MGRMEDKGTDGGEVRRSKWDGKEEGEGENREYGRKL